MSSDDKQPKPPDTTLMSLDQLSDTIEVMTGVIKRLKRHLDVQLTLHENKPATNALSQELLANERELQDLQQLAIQQQLSVAVLSDDSEDLNTRHATQRDEERSFIIEIAQHDDTDDLSNERVLH